MNERPTPPGRDAFARFSPIATRWMDNDIYGHVNNVTYHSFFDTAVNGWLIEAAGFDPARDPIVGMVAANACDYFESVRFPDPLDVGMAVERIGRTSVRYRLGVFRIGAPRAAARGLFTHVYVDRATQRPVDIPTLVRAKLETLWIA